MYHINLIKKLAAKSASSSLLDRNLNRLTFLQKENTRKKLYNILEIDLTIDVGANVGQFAEGLRNIWNGEIISFEPVAGTYEILLSKSRADDRWQVYKLGLGEREGELEINVSDNSVFSSFLTSTNECTALFGEESKAAYLETVKIKRLDDFLVNELERPESKICLKMDTQGYDLEVFSGTSKLLDRIQMIQSEVSITPLYEGAPDWHESIEKFESYGFTVAAMYPVNTIENKVIEYDCILIKK